MHKRLNKTKEAFQDYNKAAELNPKNLNSLYNRGIILLSKIIGNLYNDLGEKEKALKDFKEILERNPAHAETYNTRGIQFKNN